jgi:hypothetical protein
MKQTSPKPEPVTLHTGTLVPRNFYDRVKADILAGIPKMRRGAHATLKTICGSKRWTTLIGGEVNLAGMCAVTMARKGEVPLVVLEEKTAQNARLFVLR